MDYLVRSLATDRETECFIAALKAVLSLLSLAIDQAEVTDRVLADVKLLLVGRLVVLAYAILKHLAID